MSPKMVLANLSGQEVRFYLVDENLDFIPEVKAFLDWKAATKRAPATIKAYCSRLEWFYRFLSQRNLNALSVTPADLTEFVIWLCCPRQEVEDLSITRAVLLQETSINLILQAVGALYHFLLRRGLIDSSPVV